MCVKTSEDNCTKHLQELLEAKKDIKFMNLQFKKLGAVMRLVGNVPGPCTREASSPTIESSLQLHYDTVTQREHFSWL